MNAWPGTKYRIPYMDKREVCILSMELLTKVEKAEEAADEKRAEAQREAREILKNAEEATLVAGRSASIIDRELAAEVLETARANVQTAILERQQIESADRTALREKAAQLLDRTAASIFERIVNDGHR